MSNCAIIFFLAILTNNATTKHINTIIFTYIPSDLLLIYNPTRFEPRHSTASQLIVRATATRSGKIPTPKKNTYA